MTKARREKGPFVIEVLAAASGGKTELINSTKQRFEREGFTVQTLSAENMVYKPLRQFLHVREFEARVHGRFVNDLSRHRRSLIFRAILLDIQEWIDNSLADVVLVEQGVTYTTVVEHYGLGLTISALIQDFKFVRQPNFVVYLEVPLDVLRARPMSRMHWDRENMERICEGLNIVANSSIGRAWFRIDVEETMSLEKLSDIGWYHIWEAFTKPARP